MKAPSGHRVELCEHGTIVSQCRCPARDKPVVIVPCPPHCKEAAILPDVLEGIDVSALPPPWNKRPEVVVCVIADNGIAHPSHGWCPGVTDRD